MSHLRSPASRRPAPEDAFWQFSIDRQLQALQSSRNGLDPAEASHRFAQSGPNAVSERRRPHLLVGLVRRLSNPLVAILIAAAAVAGFTGDPASFGLITLIILLSTILDLVQEHRAEATAEALRKSVALAATVVRGGQESRIPAREIVRGDIVRIAAGDLVPADGALLEANHLQVNQALLTGEAFPVAKTSEPAPAAILPADAGNALFAGTSIVSGAGTMVVAAIGAGTRFGRIAICLEQPAPPTAFERDIRTFGLLIVRVTGFLIAFVLLTNLALGRHPLESFLFATALAVGLTPELLPMIMTVSLAHGARRLAARRVVVKRLSAIHDLGQMDVLCTDKTGTLTEADIELVGHIGASGEDDERVLELAAVNAVFETGLHSPLDDAILAHPGAKGSAGWVKLDEHPFDFERRRVTVLAEREGARIEIVKGAAEAILDLSVSRGLPGDKPTPLGERERAEIQALHDSRAGTGLRLLAIAWKPASGRTRISMDDEQGLVFGGFCLFMDPPKASATAAVADLIKAGVAIKIISGDAAPVVEHLVARLGIPLSGMMTGDEVASLGDAALRVRAEQCALFARITPDQKTRIVQALIDRGHTVGFIGDGINDAPAIKAADIGLSVDGATDVAREAADMILLAPDLEVLADGVAEGRRTFANIMKYIRMGTSSNFGNMVTMAVASLFLPFLPLLATQVLINNLIYDGSQLGIPMDEVDPQDAALPHDWDMRSLFRFTAVMGLVSTLFDLATFAVLLGYFQADVLTFRAGWFIESMATQILVVFVIRTSLPVWRSAANRYLVLSAMAGLTAAILVTFSPLRHAIGFGPLSAGSILAISGLVFGYLAASEVVKRRVMTPAVPAGVSTVEAG